eukprot:CAMPEP_0198295638 /NCGR_PEP_ID=MMETSP1449-20131203/28823_1 /TAXON_ID=420275 /ORGANISM="Attheya septentrionalis, Strain CCMP2084" /LENGTH=425 /DNA_ID=CAMNT_0043996009 /DNA_START=233 /DNA_END=1510 /DNA_ORIENTATION=-
MAMANISISKMVKILALLLLLWSVVTIFFSSLVLSDSDIDSLGFWVESSPPPPCSYELLYKAFRHHSDMNEKMDKYEATEQQQQQPRDCWRPEDEVLQIPVDAIANRHDLDAIGGGSKGGIFTAIIKLDATIGNTDTVCTAALKTEECRPMKRETLEEDADDWISCVDPRARSSDYGDMRKEFMGAFVFVAARKSGTDLPGIIPTWAIVVDDKYPSTMVGTNISYPFVVGAIMPLMKFKTFEAIENASLTHLVPNNDTVGFAKVMLPVAEALLFMKKLGMSYQDIRSKNLGITTVSQQDLNRAVVYDNTYLSFLEGATCGTTNNHYNHNMSEACNFCNKESLTLQHRYKSKTRDSIFGSDCRIFTEQVETMLELQYEKYLEDAEDSEDDEYSEDEDALILPQFRRSGTCQLQDIVENWQTIIKSS